MTTSRASRLISAPILLILLSTVLLLAGATLLVSPRVDDSRRGLQQSLTAASQASCRLPVSGPGVAGFVEFPTGGFTKDTTISPTTTVGYDATVRKWVPVPWNWISPDGLRYAAVDYKKGIVSVHDAQTGSTVRSFDLHATEVIGWDERGIFYWSISPVATSLLDPTTGAIRTITEVGAREPEWLSQSGLWNISFRVALRNPDNGQQRSVRMLAPSPNAPTPPTLLLGFDSDGSALTYELASTTSTRGNVVRTDAAGHAAIVIAAEQLPFVPHKAQGDSRGMWFTTNDGSVWLRPASGQLQKMASSIGAFVIAGRCL